MAALYYFQENSWGLSLPQDVERVAGTGDCTSVHATSPKELRVCCTHAPWEAEEPGLRAFHHDEIQFAQGAGERQVDLGHRKASRGPPLLPHHWEHSQKKPRCRRQGLLCQCWTPPPSPVPGIFWRALMHAHCLYRTEAIFKNYSETRPLFTLPNGGIHCSI